MCSDTHVVCSKVLYLLGKKCCLIDNAFFFFFGLELYIKKIYNNAVRIINIILLLSFQYSCCQHELFDGSKVGTPSV